MFSQKKKHEQKAGDAAMRMSILLAASSLSDSSRFYYDHEDSIRVDIGDFLVGEMIFSLHLLDRLAFALLRNRQFFLDVLVAAMAPHLVEANLLNQEDAIDELARMCNEKTRIWASTKWITRRGEAMDDWLFTVAARDISEASNPVFLVRYVDRLVSRFEMLKITLEGFAK